MSKDCDPGPDAQDDLSSPDAIRALILGAIAGGIVWALLGYTVKALI